MILNKPINKNITFREVNIDFKIILEYVKNNRNLTFKDFSDYELFIYSIIDTYNFGRSFKDSVENALCHLTDRDTKEDYIKLLVEPDKEASLIDVEKIDTKSIKEKEIKQNEK